MDQIENIDAEDIEQDAELKPNSAMSRPTAKTGIKGYRVTLPPVIHIGSVVERIDDNTAETEFEDMLVVLDLDRSKYHNLNVTGNVSWTRLDKPICVMDLINDLRREYDCSRAKCKSDVLIYLHQLYARRLLKIID